MAPVINGEAWVRFWKCSAKATRSSSGSSIGLAAASSSGSNLVASFHQQGVQFHSLTDSIDTGTPSGRFKASLAEMERELIAERTRAGLRVARQHGRTGGRKRRMTESKIASANKLLATGVPPQDVASNPGAPCLRSTAGRRHRHGLGVRIFPLSQAAAKRPSGGSLTSRVRRRSVLASDSSIARAIDG